MTALSPPFTKTEPEQNLRISNLNHDYFPNESTTRIDEGIESIISIKICTYQIPSTPSTLILQHLQVSGRSIDSGKS